MCGCSMTLAWCSVERGWSHVGLIEANVSGFYSNVTVQGGPGINPQLWINWRAARPIGYGRI